MGSFLRVLLPAFLLACLIGPAWAQEQPARNDGLEAALYLARTQHPSILGKRAELKALGFDLDSTQFQRLPSFSLQAQTMSDNRDQVVATLEQPLWVGGRIDEGIRQAEVGVRSGQAELVAEQRRIIEATAAAYAQLQGAQLRFKAAELNVSEHEKHKNFIRRRGEGGIASNADILLAESRLSQAIAQRSQLEGVVYRARNDLLALTQQPVAGLTPVPEERLTLPDLERIPDLVLQTSPTVILRQLSIEQAEVASRLAVAAMKPSLFVRLEQNVYDGDRDDSDSHSTRVGLVLQGTVEGLGLAGLKRVNASRTRIDSAKRDLAAAQNEARRQAIGLITDIQSLRLVLRSYEMLVKSAEETLSSFMRQHDAGRKSWVDVLNAQREFSEARLALEQSKSSLQESALRLAAQLGQLD
jgi:adhesin transport system outer membrane protein